MKVSRPRTEESRLKSRESALRRFQKPEEREKQRQIGLRQWSDPIERAKRVNFRGGKPCTEEVKNKIRVTKLERELKKLKEALNGKAGS